ncbi:hypothetical protein BLNAU_21627 [Blattamonas nauphoetae]|uniref:Secreted protein n=1 Tax=Blattamonas nauphoetae TaxID=2049346 RepID=A0ABQ9WVB5_9EUKA|nr:hypothetical protein BLNAU_21627 [Blattamonas nauphoetae]
MLIFVSSSYRLAFPSKHHIECMMSRFWAASVEISSRIACGGHSVDTAAVNKRDCETRTKGCRNSRRILFKKPQRTSRCCLHNSKSRFFWYFPRSSSIVAFGG